MAEETLKIEVFSLKVRPDPDAYEVEIFGIEVEGKDGTWSETFATEAEVRAFEKGFGAGSIMTGGPYISFPFEIKRREQ